MNFDILVIFLCMTIASTIGSDEHRPKLKIKDDARGKRNLEYQISHNYPIGANFRLERKISSGPPPFQINSRFPTYFSSRPHIHRGRPHSIPPYAVQMEPLVQYSQRDPLYDTSKIPLTAEEHNDLSKPEDLLTDNNHLSESIYPQNIHGPPYGHHQNEHPVYYQKEPEPIIEIIIKESNVTLPPVPVPTLPPKKKEPVQVFYVKYKKNPNGYGKDSVIYDKPVPALTPHVHEDEHEEPQLDQPHQEYVTLPPPPSTTLRTIIRPDSETYIGTSGIHVTFGSEDKKHKSSPEGHEESAPQPAVAFPQAQTQQQSPHKNPNHHQIQQQQQQQHHQTQQHHHHQQQQQQHQQQHQHQQHHHQQHHQQPQPQFSQPIPERKPPTSAFPPNFNPPINFNQQSFGSRPVPNQPPQFVNTQYRPVHQQPARPFPAASQNQQQRAPVPPQRTFQQQQQQPFNHQRPLGPPQLPSLPSLQRPAFNPPPSQFPPNHFNQNHQTPPFTLNQFSLNNQFPPNHQFHFSQPNQPFPPPNQFPGFPQPHFPQSQKTQFSQILNQRPQTHFPIVQQPQFNHKPQNQNEQFKHQQHNHQLRGNQQPQPPQQQQQQQQQPQQTQHQPSQNYQFHNQNIQSNRPNNQPPQHHNQQQQSQIQHHQQQHQSQQQNHQSQQQNHQHNQQNHQQNQQQQQHLQQLQQSTPHIIPPGGELLKSVPKFEQHISIPAEPAPQIHNAQALPLQSQSSINQNVASPGQTHHQLSQQSNNHQLNPQSNHQNFQQLQVQLQQQINQQQQQFNQQFQQQLKQDQLLQQQKTLSPLDFRQQIQQQFQFPLQNFAQLNNIQNKVSPTTAAPKQENIYVQPNAQRSQTPSPLSPNYFNIQQQQSSFYQTHQNPGSIYQGSPTSPNIPSSTAAPKVIYQSTTTTTTTTSKPIEKTEEKKTNKLPANIQLPDEVPDDLREQLLSSGILSNADISVLDYDKIGDIPIDALPPDQLANFYGAGGAQQLSASERKETFLRPDGLPIDSKTSMVNMDEELSAEESEIDEVKTFEASKQPEMKVVRYDSLSEQGQSVQNSYVRDDAMHVDPVVLNDNKYNRYLPLKVSGAQFPIPDVPELKGRNITSVVVLAPVDYEFHQHNKNERSARDIEGDIKDVKLKTADALKALLKDPTKENYKRWLDKENQTAADKQSVILLVTGSPENNEKEIFMYDVASKSVSKLSGELSSAFVEAAESNANDEIPDASQVYESRVDEQKS